MSYKANKADSGRRERILNRRDKGEIPSSDCRFIFTDKYGRTKFKQYGPPAVRIQPTPMKISNRYAMLRYVNKHFKKHLTKKQFQMFSNNILSGYAQRQFIYGFNATKG